MSIETVPPQLGSDNDMRRRFPLAIFDELGGTGIPAYALVMLGPPINTEFGKPRKFSALKPYAASADLVVVNGPLAIATGGSGFATNHYPARVLYDGSGASASDPKILPTVGSEWGPLAGSFALRPASVGGKGFKIVGGVNEDNSTVEAMKIASGAASTQSQKFVCVGNKSTRHLTVKGRLLNADLTPADGGSLTDEIGAIDFYDPFTQYYSRTQNYVGSEHPFQGRADLSRDPAGVEPDRYEIIGMDRFIKVIKGRLTKVSNYPQPGSTLKIEYLGAANSATPANPLDQFPPGWDRRIPAIKGAADGSQYTGYYADADIPFDASGIIEPDFGFGKTSAWPWPGIFEIGDPETVPPNYRIRQMRMVRMGTVYSVLHKSFGTNGQVQLFKDGTRTNDGSPIPAIINPWNADATVGADVRVDFSFSPPRADAFTCGA